MQRHWQLRKNCCLTPRQLAVGLGAPCCLSLAIGLWFTLRGAWPVLAFALLQALSCALLFVHFARHVGDHESITLRHDCLQIDVVVGGSCRRTLLNPHWTSIVPPGPRHALIGIESMGRKYTVGRFVPAGERWRVAIELQRELHQV